jgi:hypothetical protein
MDSEIKKLIAGVTFGIVVCIVLPVFFWIGASKMEAKAFNSVTGKHVTTWEAMWIELRVQEQSK